MVNVNVRIRIDEPTIDRWMRTQAGPAFVATQRAGQRVLNAARTLAPVDEGRLRASLAMEMRAVNGVPVARIGSNLPYALYVHEGTGIYVGRGYIVPKRARVLRWPVKNNTGAGRRRYQGGRTAAYAYARRVRGVPPRPFLRDALRAARR